MPEKTLAETRAVVDHALEEVNAVRDQIEIERADRKRDIELAERRAARRHRLIGVAIVVLFTVGAAVYIRDDTREDRAARERCAAQNEARKGNRVVARIIIAGTTDGMIEALKATPRAQENPAVSVYLDGVKAEIVEKVVAQVDKELQGSQPIVAC